MSQSLLQRRLVDVSERLKRIRAELAVTEEQLGFLEEEAEDVRLRALVAETPLADVEARDARRQADAQARHAESLRRTVSELQREQDSLLDRISAELSARGRPGSAVTDPRPTRVVIAEDEAIIRLDLKELLQEDGYDVVGETGRGDEAVELVRDLRPDLVILDIKMPGLDGLSAARAIAADRLAAVLMVTAFSQRELVEQARDAGALAYLVKPFQKSDLIPAIEVALGRFAELTALERDLEDLQARLDARKVIDRAKGRLMDEHGMTEQDAWRFLQQQAMTNRVRNDEIARRVIDGELTP
jgi:two-component system, response regulator PdtaR